ncbi:MAG: NAD-binding protein [Halobacteria archaeon]
MKSLKNRLVEQNRKITDEVLVVGNDYAGIEASGRIEKAKPVFFTTDESMVNGAERHLDTTYSFPKVTELLKKTEVEPDTAIVATSNDSRNLLVSQNLRTRLGIDDIVVRVNDRQYLE